MIYAVLTRAKRKRLSPGIETYSKLGLVLANERKANLLQKNKLAIGMGGFVSGEGAGATFWDQGLAVV